MSSDFARITIAYWSRDTTVMIKYNHDIVMRVFRNKSVVNVVLTGNLSPHEDLLIFTGNVDGT